MFSAWLMWGELSPDLRRAVLAMAIDEADRFLDLPAPYSRFYDTKAEENAWNSNLLVLLGEILKATRTASAGGTRFRIHDLGVRYTG
jgi:hypothetical protein